MISKIDFTTATIDLTDRCNDRCRFCFNQNFLGSGDEITLAEIKKKLAAAEKIQPIKQIILSGGEPTLHPDFFGIFEFFANETNYLVSLNTNSVIFSDQDFREKLLSILRSAKNQRQKFSLSFSNLENWPPQNDREKAKTSGFKEAVALAVSAKIRLVVVVIITRQNFRFLPEIAQFVSRQIKSRATFSLRSLYLDAAMTNEQKDEVVPPNFAEVQPFLDRAITEVLANPNLKLRLFGLPLCYFRDSKNFDEIVARAEPWWHESRFKIRKNLPLQFKNFHEDVWSLPNCKNCIFSPVCNKIQTEFLDKYEYPSLTPF